ncbi:hypothetical protein [Roseisolibacter agri]|uniref:Uncharacterized protein n=1 Tax=Roseisolibacter agri TaxID=2014610 RepID=A0AA37VDE1_9BACT|nr:hypothetical protein [Roseisolibacter agri]GLC23519.1 hypothetical protein rosag_00320 [Roseisolibacter agri]
MSESHTRASPIAMGVTRPAGRAGRVRRSARLFIAVFVGAIAARSVHVSVLIDACLDAGGRYLTEPARCEIATGAARALTAMPRRSGWWLPVAGSGLAAGALAYGVGRVLLRPA